MTKCVIFRVVGQLDSCRGGLWPLDLNFQGVPALGERRYSKPTYYTVCQVYRKWTEVVFPAGTR